jgi:sugar/nucleoside kinase (ribokinase family)
MAGTVGDDPAGAQALGPLVRAGVDVDRVARVAGAPTRRAWVLVEREGGERTVLERRSAALRMPAGSVASLAPACGRVLLVDLEHPDASREVAARARRDGIPVVLDADRATPAALLLAREVDFPIVSRGFAEEFSSDASLEDGLRGLCGPQTRMAVVTCGERGSVARLGDRVLRTPATRVEVRDTTGAGDVFRGAFAWALVRGLDADRVLRVANAAAAFSCRGEGAQGALPESSELESGLQGGGRWQA